MPIPRVRFTVPGADPERDATRDALDAMATAPGLPCVQAVLQRWPIRCCRPAGFRISTMGRSFPDCWSAVHPATGNVGLMIQPNPDGPTGFVRASPANSQNRAGPFQGDDLLRRSRVGVGLPRGGLRSNHWRVMPALKVGEFSRARTKWRTGMGDPATTLITQSSIGRAVPKSKVHDSWKRPRKKGRKELTRDAGRDE